MKFIRKLKLFYASRENSILRYTILAIILWYLLVNRVSFSNKNFSENDSISNEYFIARQVILLKNYTSKNTSEHCPSVPPNLRGKINVTISLPFYFNAHTSIFNDSNDRALYFNALKNGGYWRPLDCLARHRVAIVIPYKNRFDQLNIFLYHMHPFLQTQQLDYQIFVVEQVNDALFNKGILMNACFKEILNLYSKRGKLFQYPFDCVIFHDVDLLPEDDRIMYTCPFSKARHLSVAIDKFNYKMFYYKLIGGVLNFKTSHFIRVNGYSNEYWGWGGEDDDMETRLTHSQIGYERPNINIAHYKMLKHGGSVKNPTRRQLLRKAITRYKSDGINNVKYKLLSTHMYKMFTHFLVDVGDAPLNLIKTINASAEDDNSNSRTDNTNKDSTQKRVLWVNKRFKKPF
jgi:hypothetical protein